MDFQHRQFLHNNAKCFKTNIYFIKTYHKNRFKNVIPIHPANKILFLLTKNDF